MEAGGGSEERDVGLEEEGPGQEWCKRSQPSLPSFGVVS